MTLSSPDQRPIRHAVDDSIEPLEAANMKVTGRGGDDPPAISTGSDQV